MDLAFHRILGAASLVAPIKIFDGTRTAPGLEFGSEPTSGLYRAAAGDIRLSVLDQDIVCFGKLSGSAALGLGTVPAVNMHIKRDLAGNFTPWLAENANTTDGNAILMEYRGTTTGVGAAAFQPFAWFTLSQTIHDHPTRAGQVVINWADAGTFRAINFVNNGQIRKSTGDIELKSNAGNGNVILTPNGTGRVQLGLDGLIATPALTFVSETGMGFYRASAGVLRLAISSTDILQAQRISFLSVTNTPALGIGVVPLRPLHVALSDPTAGSTTVAAFENSSSTDGNGAVFSFRSTTTGVGAATFQEFASIDCSFTTHNHATRTGQLNIGIKNSAVDEIFSFVPGKIFQISTGSLTLKSAGGNGAIVLLPNGTGRVQLGLDGAVATPALTFTSETTAGFYRAGAGDIRFVISSTDILVPARISFTGATNVAAMGIGTVPSRPLHIKTTVVGNNFSQVILENPDTTDGFGQIIDFLSTTTGVGATSGVSFANIRITAVTHDHPTRTSDIRLIVKNAGTNEEFQFKAGRILQTDTGDFTLKCLAGNGNIILTPNGTGTVKTSAIFQTNNISAFSGSVTTFDSNLVLPVARAIRFTAGTNQRGGDAVLVAGTVTVGCTSVTANTRVFLTRKTLGGTAGDLTYTLNAGVGFTINSALPADTSTISFALIEVS